MKPKCIFIIIVIFFLVVALVTGIILVAKTNQAIGKSQELIYTVARGKSIYHYEIDAIGSPTKITDYGLPFEALFTRITYNYQLSCLEIVGDYYDDLNTNHFQMTLTGDFYNYSESLFEGVTYGSLVYIETVGTLCIGGNNGSNIKRFLSDSFNQLYV